MNSSNVAVNQEASINMTYLYNLGFAVQTEIARFYHIPGSNQQSIIKTALKNIFEAYLEISPSAFECARQTIQAKFD
jgi:hypothetical protein